MPGVEDLVAALGHEEHAQVGLTGSEHSRPTVFVHQAHEMQIVGKLAAGNERPAAAQPAPPCSAHGPSGRSCGAREQPTGVAENPLAPGIIQEAGPKTGQRVVPNEPGHRRFRARQRLEDSQPLFWCAWRGCASVEQHATQLALANGSHNRFSNTPVILGGVAQIADQRC